MVEIQRCKKLIYRFDSICPGVSTECTSDELSTCTGDLSSHIPMQSAEFERYCQSVDFHLATLL